MGLVVAVAFYFIFLPRIIQLRGDFALTCHWRDCHTEEEEEEGDRDTNNSNSSSQIQALPINTKKVP
jgi:hypothetical protein